jgi:hypothetical protein
MRNDLETIYPYLSDMSSNWSALPLLVEAAAANLFSKASREEVCRFLRLNSQNDEQTPLRSMAVRRLGGSLKIGRIMRRRPTGVKNMAVLSKKCRS